MASKYFTGYLVHKCVQVLHKHVIPGRHAFIVLYLFSMPGEREIPGVFRLGLDFAQPFACYPRHCTSGGLGILAGVKRAENE